MDDPVNHPSHYTAYNGLEIIDLTEQMNFNRGNAIKYIARAGLKNKETEIEDLSKALWYIEREIKRMQRAAAAAEAELKKLSIKIENAVATSPDAEKTYRDLYNETGLA